MYQPKTSIIYDLDGTIVDTEKFHLSAWDKTVKKYGLGVSGLDIHLSSLGTSTIATLKKLFGGLEESKCKEIASFKFESLILLIENSDVDLMPGFYEAWESLCSMGLAVGVCTAARSENVQALEKSGGRVAEVLGSLRGKIVTKEMCKNGKPSPDPLIEAIRLVGSPTPKEVLYIGDAPADFATARAAGVEYLHFAPAPIGQSFSGVIIRDHRELLSIVGKTHR